MASSALLVGLALTLTGCKRASIDGRVVDGFGDPVQDATVRVEGTEFVSGTNSKGEYSVRYVPGDITVLISKAGYTETSFSAKIATESTFPAESKTIYRIPGERGIWYMDFGTKQYVPIRTGAVQANETMEHIGWHRYWHRSHVVQLLESNHTAIPTAGNRSVDLMFVDNTGVDTRLIQLDPLAGGRWSLLEKSWSDGVMVEDASKVTILSESNRSAGNGLNLRTVNVAPGHAYAFADYSAWGGGEMSGLAYLFIVEEKSASGTDPPTAPPQPSALVTAPASSTTSPPAEQRLVLRGNGLGEISFGNDADRVIAVVNARLGQPTEDDRNPGCESSADRVVKWPGFYAVFDRGRWDGYRLRSTDVRAATEAGLKVGATVADLQAAYPSAELMETTLGDEWFVEVGTEHFLTGLLSGPAPSDTVVDIAAGDTCVFR
jgi:hypothetical protein